MGIEGIGFNPNIERAGWPACCSHEEAKDGPRKEVR